MSWCAAPESPNNSSKCTDLATQQRLGDLAQPADQLEILAPGEERIDVRFLGHVSKTSAKRNHVARDVVAVEEHDAVGRVEEAGDHLDGRRLARSVRAQVADDLAGTHDEAHLVDGGNPVESLGQLADFEHRDWLVWSGARSLYHTTW